VGLFLIVLSGVVLPLLVSADDISVILIVADTECSDGVDNDGDFLIDFPADTSCTSALDDDESDLLLFQCNDGTDNDGDGQIDFPADIGCDSLLDDNETNPSSGGGGGGGGSSGSADITYEGFAAPNRTVTVLLDGVVYATTTADETGSFFSEIENVKTGTRTFGFYSTDITGFTTEVTSVTFRVRKNQDVALEEIIVPPSIVVDKAEVAQTSSFVVFGETLPNATVVIEVHSEAVLIATTTARANGTYSHEFLAQDLEFGTHIAYATTFANDQLSSQQVTSQQFVVGDVDVLTDTGCVRKGDLNGDCNTNLTDFSIMLYWWDRELSTDFLGLENTRLSGDGRLSLTDLSVMAFYWNGTLP